MGGRGVGLWGWKKFTEEGLVREEAVVMGGLNREGRGAARDAEGKAQKTGIPRL